MITKEEIESVQILKDAAATALYGLRGANGVMLVTTKTGSKKKIDVSVNYEYAESLAEVCRWLYLCIGNE